MPPSKKFRKNRSRKNKTVHSKAGSRERSNSSYRESPGSSERAHVNTLKSIRSSLPRDEGNFTSKTDFILSIKDAKKAILEYVMNPHDDELRQRALKKTRVANAGVRQFHDRYRWRWEMLIEPRHGLNWYAEVPRGANVQWDIESLHVPDWIRENPTQINPPNGTDILGEPYTRLPNVER